MGVQGLWLILLHAAEKQSLQEFAANEGFCSQGGPGGGLKLLTIGMDASTWIHSVCAVFRYNHAGAGPHPELCTLFYQLAALLTMPVHAFFVFDGHRQPSTKRRRQTGGKSHWLSNGFQWCGRRFIDMVLTMDNDTLIFGTTCVAHCPDNPRHFDNIEIYTEHIIAGSVRLTRVDRVLIALDGIQGCGIKIAHPLSQYKLGKVLLNALLTMQRLEFIHFLRGWQDDLRQVLETDPGGFLGREYVKIAGAIPNSFPNYGVLQLYVSPLTTFSGMAFCEQHFGWKNEGIVIKLCATIWEGAALRLMCRLPRQPGGKTTPNSIFKLLHRRVVDTTGSKLVVFTLQYHGRQFADAVWMALSLPPSEIISELDGPEDEELVHMTLPACVVKYAFPADAQRFTDQCTEQMPTLDAGCEAREQAEVCAFLCHPDLPPRASGSGSQVLGTMVIDLTKDSDSENFKNSIEYDDESEEIVG
ncbi:hypothetical protein BDN67DRAFT_1015663 [Paxillus ammoniavirescens]|nr:hypothetical protein BDN67DRAFT_1015663 [Paxillus ammoniavirescens]